MINIIDQSALSFVANYQRHISPHKGFVCAHRVAYGGPSCSQFFYELIIENGLFTALTKLISRCKECREAANLLLTARNEEKNNEPSNDNQALYCLGDDCSSACCFFPW